VISPPQYLVERLGLINLALKVLIPELLLKHPILFIVGRILYYFFTLYPDPPPLNALPYLSL
jgi:hypothetical protein